MDFGIEIISEGRGVKDYLHDCIKEARVAKIMKAWTNFTILHWWL